MIKKFITIKGVGKFLDYIVSRVTSSAWNGEFKKINLIYGENGSGKTTLSMIFRSLKGDDILLSKIRSFDRTNSTKIEILTDDLTQSIYTFDTNLWNKHYPEIEIFDVHFINENIYTGLEIQTAHKRKLFEVIFGHHGVQLKKEIQVIKDKIRDNIYKFRDCASKIELITTNILTTKEFCELQADSDIDNKIRDKESEIALAKSYETILAKQQLSTIPLVTLPFDRNTTIEILGQSVESISKTYLELFKKHKYHLGMAGNAENWIKQGYEMIADNKCPFCLQPIDDNIEIIKAYQQYFNEEYNDLIARISHQKKELTKFNIDATLLALENIIVSNQSLLEFWKNHISDSPNLEKHLENKQEIIDSYNNVKSLFQQKILDPLTPLNTVSIEEFFENVELVNKKITIINNEIIIFNENIELLKESGITDLPQLELELRKLNVIKKRIEPEIEELCTKYIDCEKNLKDLDESKIEKQQQLDSYSIAVFKNYSVKINQYLQAFAPYLEVRGLESVYVTSSTEPQVKYALFIRGNEIKNEDNAYYPTFKYSLSEGDKSALALAFFLTKLDIEGNLQNKIIVFDDPISSFDLNRKSTTISKLVSYGTISNQLFVLSHNIVFAGEFWKSSTQTGEQHQCCQIAYMNNSSCLVEFDIDTETLANVLKDSLTIKNYLDIGCLTDQERRNVARCLRPALESYFRLKFFDLVLSNEWLGSFISKVRSSTQQEPWHRLLVQIDELNDINNYSKRFHHGFNNNADQELINDSELRNYCEKTLKLIQLI